MKQKKTHKIYWFNPVRFILCIYSVWIDSDSPPHSCSGTHTLFLCSFALGISVGVKSRWKGQSFSSVAQSCPTLCNPMNRSTPGLFVHHQLLELTQTHVGVAIQPSHPLSSPSPPVPNPSQHQGLFPRVNPSQEVVKVLEFQLQQQSFQ